MNQERTIPAVRAMTAMMTAAAARGLFMLAVPFLVLVLMMKIFPGLGGHNIDWEVHFFKRGI